MNGLGAQHHKPNVMVMPEKKRPLTLAASKTTQAMGEEKGEKREKGREKMGEIQTFAHPLIKSINPLNTIPFSPEAQCPYDKADK